MQRYYVLTKSDGTTAKIIARGGLRASASRMRSYCLDAGSYAIQAIDTLSEGWFSGDLRVVVNTGDGRVEYRGITPFAGAASNLLEFSVPAVPLQSVADSNRAGGGGGVVFWEEKEPLGSVIEIGGNQAVYGDYIATPATFLQIANNSNNSAFSAASGATIYEPWAFTLRDQYWQVASSSIGVAIARVADEASEATVANNIAEFVDGKAIFEVVQITLYPGALVRLRVQSPLSTLIQSFIDFNVQLRPCYKNEFVDVDTCSECEKGTFLKGGTCRDCHQGIDCSEEGSELSVLVTKNGYYRATDTSEIAYHCFVNDACPHTSKVGYESCRNGHEGHTCSSCRSNYYATLSGICRKCSRDVTVAVFISYGIFSLVFVAFLSWLVCFEHGTKLCMNVVEAHAGAGAHDAVSLVHKVQHSGSIHETDQDETDKKQVLIFVKLKTVYTFAQLAASLPAVVGNLDFPASYTAMLRIASLSNFSFLDIVPTRCMWRSSSSIMYVNGLIVMTSAPILFSAILYSVYKLKVFLHGPMTKRKQLFYTEFFLLVTHLVLSITSVATFQVFVCDDFDAGDNGKISVLRVERTVRCDSLLWKRLSVYASFMILIYPVGIPLLYAVLLFTHNTQLNPKHITTPLLNSHSPSLRRLMGTSFKQAVESSTAHQRKISDTRASKINEGLFANILAFRFLWADYRCAWYWWELVECARRLFLTCVLALISPGTTAQIACGFVVSNVFSMSLMTVKPFLYRDDNLLVTIAQLCTSVSMFIALSLKVGILTKEESSPLFILNALIPMFMMFYVLRNVLVSCFGASETQKQRKARYSPGVVEGKSCAPVNCDHRSLKKGAVVPTTGLQPEHGQVRRLSIVETIVEHQPQVEPIESELCIPTSLLTDISDNATETEFLGDAGTEAAPESRFFAR